MTTAFFYREKIIVILLTSVFVFLTTKTYAENDSVLTRSSNAVYQFISDHEYLVVPLSDAAAGLSLCGPWCALAGGVAGVADEGLIYFGYADRRYLTYGLLGGATGHVFSVALTSTGILSGVYFSGAFEGHEELVAPAFAITLGFQAGGINGGSLSLIGSTIDELFIQNGYTKKYPATTFVLVPKFLSKILGPGMATLVTVYLNTIIYNEQNFSDILKSKSFTDIATKVPMMEMVGNYTRVAMKLYENYDKFIPQKEFKEHIEKNVITLLGGQLLIHWLVVKQILLNQNLEYYFEHLDQVAHVAGNPLVSQGIKVAVFIIPWVVGQAVTSSIEGYYNDKLSIMLKDNIQKKLFSQENLLRLSNNENFSVYMDNLNRDISAVTNLGSSLVSSGVSTSVSGAYGASMIIIHSRSILVYTFLYQMISGLIMQHLTSQSMGYEDDLKSLNSRLLALYEDAGEHVRTITERDGINATGKRVQAISTSLIETERERDLWNMGLQLYLGVDKIIGTVLNYYLVGKEIQQGRLNFNNRKLLQKAVMDETGMFSWGDRNLQAIGQVEKSLDRLIVLEGVIDLPPSNNDQIRRIIQEGNQLILRDLEIGIGDRILVTVDELKLDMGKVYDFDGPTGCGKTSFLSKIKGLRENGISGKGEIRYPKIGGKYPKIVMLSQQDYFRPNSSFREILLYPEESLDDSEINMLLMEMGLSRFISQTLNLDSRENWYRLLSGGEKKKILIISAILKKPNILILDEVFNGLDLESIRVAQQILKKYLPNSLMLVVDHHAATNNYNFYDKKVSFVDKKLVLQDMK